jgi:DNA-binding NarL/FixJ family response regulator
MIRILIADDHQIFVDGLCAMLKSEADIEVVGTVDTGQRVLDFLSVSCPELVVLDIKMPNMNGLQVAKKMKDDFPAVKTLLLSMHDQAHIIKEALDSEVDGYLLKSVDKEEFILAIRNIVNGRQHYSSEVTNILFKNKNSRQSTTANLTRRELEVLRLIAKAKTTEEIANDLFVSIHTIKTHRKNLLSKLQVNNTAGLVAYAYENDLLDVL